MGNFEPTVFSFQKQLQVGSLGEDLLIRYYHMPIIKSQDRKYDFLCVHTGHKIELKTDSYDITRTPFFFFERYSNSQKETPGGPWRAVQDRVPIFVYMFVKNNRYFVFKDMKKLLKKIDRDADKGIIQPVLIRNKGWVTSGFKIDRMSIKEYWTEYEFNPALPDRAKPVTDGMSEEVK
jgi:hypothetical protein